MSRQWSCATLGAGVVSVDNDFLANAMPEALAAYESDLLQQIAVSFLNIATTPDNISSGELKKMLRCLRHCRATWAKLLQRRLGAFASYIIA